MVVAPIADQEQHRRNDKPDAKPSTAWLTTSTFVTSARYAINTNEGTIVMPRRIHTGMRIG